MVPFKRRKLVCSAAGSHTGATGSHEGATGSHEGATGSHEGATGSHEGTRFPQVVLFLMERKMGASRRRFLSQLGEKKGFQVEQLLSERVTHVICENNSSEEVRTWLRSEVGGQTAAHLLDVSWFTESMKAGRPVEVLDRHKLQEQQTEEVEVFSTPSYACQRRTTLDNHNAVLTDALSLLAENAELSGEDGRGVAFRRAAAALKALPLPVTRLTQLGGVPCLGGHSLRVIKDVLESGASPEVEALRRSERFKALKVLTGIFGVGVKTAGRWIGEGILTLRQLRDSGPTLNRAQRAGLRHYDDLNRPVGRAEAAAVAAVVEAAAGSVLPGARVTLIGGFRRGKQTGHDVDFLITHPEEGREAGLMPKLVSWLDSQGFLLYQKTNSNSYLEAAEGPARPASNMDRFERCFSVFKLPEEAGRGGAGAGGEGGPRPWRAVRVDLVVSPVSQFAFALLGWTGSKLFERELRRWAGHEMNMCLSSHALYDHRQSRYLRASSEEEIFAHLGLEYIPPSERNA